MSAPIAGGGGCSGTALPPIRVGFGAFDVAITPNGSTAYALTGSRVTLIRTATNTTLPPVYVKAPGIAITPDGRTVYVTLFGAVDRKSGTVIPIRTTTREVLPPIKVGELPIAIAITPATG